ncbi:hypothetical protein [Actinomadura macra]|uniref:hypothetical protein n=1 Tax=Actinomadura macra TaxID=46164 RepID=UPI0008358E2E|nr:hypothetical protein [Actinomadura macra]
MFTGVVAGAGRSFRTVPAKLETLDFADPEELPEAGPAADVSRRPNGLLRFSVRSLDTEPDGSEGFVQPDGPREGTGEPVDGVEEPGDEPDEPGEAGRPEEPGELDEAGRPDGPGELDGLDGFAEPEEELDEPGVPAEPDEREEPEELGELEDVAKEPDEREPGVLDVPEVPFEASPDAEAAGGLDGLTGAMESSAPPAPRTSVEPDEPGAAEGAGTSDDGFESEGGSTVSSTGAISGASASVSDSSPTLARSVLVSSAEVMSTVASSRPGLAEAAATVLPGLPPDRPAGPFRPAPDPPLLLPGSVLTCPPGLPAR